MVYILYNQSFDISIIRFNIDLVAEMADWARDDVATADPLLLRFMTHLVLFFRSIGLNTNVRDVIVLCLC